MSQVLAAIYQQSVKEREATAKTNTAGAPGSGQVPSSARSSMVQPQHQK